MINFPEHHSWYLPSLKLAVRTWKWMVGIRLFPFGAHPIFRAKMLVLGMGNFNLQIHPSRLTFCTFPHADFGSDHFPFQMGEPAVDEPAVNLPGCTLQESSSHRWKNPWKTKLQHQQSSAAKMPNHPSYQWPWRWKQAPLTYKYKKTI